MRRISALMVVLVVLSIGIAGCSGGGSKVGPPASIKLTSGSNDFLSLQPGQFQIFVATVLDASGNVITNPPTITWSSSPSSIATVAPSNVVPVTGAAGTPATPGTVCAGSWNTAAVTVGGTTFNPFTICTPGGTGQATITASIPGGISGSAIAYVHRAIDSVVIEPPTPNPNTIAACLSQGVSSGNFIAHACSLSGIEAQGLCPAGMHEITTTVGPFTWTVINPSSIATPTPATAPPFTATLKAQTPGLGTVQAAASGVSGSIDAAGSTVHFVTCPVGSIAVSPATFGPVSTGTSTSLTAVVKDILGITITNVPLTWSSSQPASITATTGSQTSTAAAVAGGTSSIVASCTPPACNANLPSGGSTNNGYPVYSNLVVGSVTTAATTPETTLFVASSSAASTGGSTTMFAVDTFSLSSPPITLPAIPNSMVMNSAGTKLYMGSNSAGLMIMDTSTNTVTQLTTCGVFSCAGKVLAVSPDGNTVLVSNESLGGSQVFAISGSVQTLTIPNATRASFSPDSLKAYIVTSPTGDVWVFQAGTTEKDLSLTNVADANFLSQGSVAFLAGPLNTLDMHRTCDDVEKTPNPTTNPLQRVRTLPGRPFVSGVFQDQQMLAADDNNIYAVGVSADGTTTFGATCDVSPTLSALSTVPSPTTGMTVNQILVTPDSKVAYITSDKGLISYEPVSQAISTVSLGSGTVTPTMGTFTLDSNFLYLGVTGTFNAVIPYSKVNQLAPTTPVKGTNISFNPSTFVPDLVAVKPK